jgi:hypothetical protein
LFSSFYVRKLMCVPAGEDATCTLIAGQLGLSAIIWLASCEGTTTGGLSGYFQTFQVSTYLSSTPRSGQCE